MKAKNREPHTFPIKDVVVGTRHRRDLGNIAELARSIEEVGLLHPVVLRPDGTLIAGARRLAACKHLGWQEIPVTVVHIDRIARGEFAENVHRKNFLPSEIDAIFRSLDPFRGRRGEKSYYINRRSRQQKRWR
jgi:ParB family chromosome partitioning protein